MPSYFDFEVSLAEIHPKIWRRFLIASNATFQQLHDAIQEAGDWGDYHLFAFHEKPNWNPGGVIAGIPDDEYGEPAPDARRVRVADWFRPDNPRVCYYLYDFGDSWWHRVKLLGIVSHPGRFRRRLLGGARAFPPEDAGGISGYEECVQVATTGVDVEGRLEWLGGWTPEEFDLEAARLVFDVGGKATPVIPIASAKNKTRAKRSARKSGRKKP